MELGFLLPLSIGAALLVPVFHSLQREELASHALVSDRECLSLSKALALIINIFILFLLQQYVYG